MFLTDVLLTLHIIGFPTMPEYYCLSRIKYVMLSQSEAFLFWICSEFGDLEWSISITDREPYSEHQV